MGADELVGALQALKYKTLAFIFSLCYSCDMKMLFSRTIHLYIIYLHLFSLFFCNSGMPYNVPKEPLQLAEMLKSLLSKNYTPKSFAEEILGFEDYAQDN